MGGKTWSREEERLLWEVIIPQSKDAAYPGENPLDWEQLAKLMNELAGGIARRKYTKNMLYEHYYQNKQPGHTSPKAAEFVEKYLLDSAYFKEHGCRRPPTPPNASPASEPRDPQLVELLRDKLKPKSKSKTRRQCKGRVPWERDSEGQPSRQFISMSKAVDETGAYSVTPGNAAQHLSLEGYATSTRADVVQSDYPFSKSALAAVPGPSTVWDQPVDGLEVHSRNPGHPTMAFDRSSKPDSGFLKLAVAERMEGGYWSSAPRAEQDQRFKKALPMASGSISDQTSQAQSQPPAYASSLADPAPSRQRVLQEQWDGRLPSIREMLPYEFGQPTYDTSACELNRRVDRHSLPSDQNYMQVPESTSKRRRLPNAPIRRQQHEQQVPHPQN
ncbi:hypothetical protein FLONG3_1896 [Fusarium longipes]|uniref:Uncharacterized protein n=1 Tax=Fusarium longipes TaxID=694270 RepID=A0A395T6M3_9HYPO|nr:hypothetical protein FLONG3_1896 [Fusarium longipes]